MVAEPELPQQLLGALVDLGMLLIQRHPMPDMIWRYRHCKRTVQPTQVIFAAW